MPIGIRQAVFHGTENDEVPYQQSLKYAAAATAVGDKVDLFTLEGIGHMEFLDPNSMAVAQLRTYLKQLLQAA